MHVIDLVPISEAFFLCAENTENFEGHVLLKYFYAPKIRSYVRVGSFKKI